MELKLTQSGFRIIYIIYHIFFKIYSSVAGHLGGFHMLTIVINASVNHIDLFHLPEILQGRAGTSPSLQTRSRKGDSIWRRRNIGSRFCLSYISTSPTGEAVCFALQIVVPGLHFFSFTSSCLIIKDIYWSHGYAKGPWLPWSEDK